jgi:peptidoglycan/LPS O-acetylase OafA/YrhL
MEEPEGRRPNYWPGLDGIRGLSIVAVFVFHADQRLLPAGGAGVDLFFVLSGFLITRLLIVEWRRRGRISLKRFYQRRALRLLPALFVVLPAAVIAGWLALPTGEHRRLVTGALSALLYVANIRRAAHPQSLGIFGPTWSLSMEEQFYVLWPCVLVLLLRMRVQPQTIVSVAGAGFAAAAAWHYVAASALHTTPAAVLYRPDLRVDGLLLGVTIGAVHGFGWLDRAPRSPALWRTLAWIAAVAVAVFMRWPQIVPTSAQATLGVTGVAIAAGFLVVERIWSPGSLLSRGLEWGPLVRLGQVSYVVYLVHVPALKVTRAVLDRAGIATTTLIALLLTLAVSTAIHLLVEVPALRLKERFSVEPLPPTEQGSALAQP